MVVDNARNQGSFSRLLPRLMPLLQKRRCLPSDLSMHLKTDAMPQLDSFATRASGIALLWLSVLATVAGYLAYSLYDPVQLVRWKMLLWIALAINGLSLLAWLQHRNMPLPLLTGGMWLVAAVFHIGLAPTLATGLIALCALGVGSLLLGKDDDADALGALLVGLALMAAVAGWLLPFPIHRRWLYFTCILLAVIIRAGVIGRLLRETGTSALAVTRASPAAAFIVINLVGICSTPAWLPTMQADDISYHLALPFQLQDLGYYRMDVTNSVFALAPWAADLIHAMAQLVAGTESRGAVNLMWMIALYSGMLRLGHHLGLPSVLSWAAIALHCSLPLTSSLLAGMQTELPTSAILVGLALMVGIPSTLTPRRVACIATLAALLLAIKASNALLLLPLAVWLVVRFGGSLPWKALPACTLLGGFVALPSYTYAQIIAGNPFLPLLNGVFKSPYFALKNWKDAAWMHPIDATLPWQLTFDTAHYLTAPNGGAGFVYLFCTMGVVIALFHRRVRPIALIGLAGFLLVFLQIHFIRYTHPATALLILAALGGFHALGMRRTAIAGAAVLCALNLSLLGSGYWQIRDGALDLMVRSGREATLERFAPQRVIAGKLRAGDDGESRVLFHKVDAHGNAELSMPTVTTSWYNWNMVRVAGEADADPTGERWRHIFAQYGINLLVVDRDKISEGLGNALAPFTVDPRLSIGNLEVWRIESTSISGPPLQPVNISKENATFRYTGIEGGNKVSTTAKFRCNRSNEPIVISMLARLRSSETPQNLLSAWAMCTNAGIAEGELEAHVPADLEELLFIAWPRSPMDFEMLESQTTVKQDAAQPPRDPAKELRNELLDLLPGDEIP